MAAVERWEYRRITVFWDSDAGDWVARFTDGDIQGFNAICNNFGQQGWELVAVEPKEWNAPKYRGYERHEVGGNPEQVQYRTMEWEVTTYLCFFKRRLA